MSISATQLDRLGTRLKSGAFSADDLRLLDDYRRSFFNASSAVLKTLREQFGVEPTARPAKSTAAIVEKLCRQQTRLTQMQDIAGCRVVVRNMAEQRELVSRLQQAYTEAQIHDRLAAPSHGYRAVHLIVRREARWVEIQIRTELQHLWAVLSEKVADRFDHAIKYGGGPSKISGKLQELSDMVHSVETSQDQLDRWVKRAKQGSLEVVGGDLESASRENSDNRRILQMSLEKMAAEPDYLLSLK